MEYPQTRHYRWVRIRRKHVLQLFVAYPDDPVSHGPYCVRWIDVKYKDLPKYRAELRKQGITEVKLENAPLKYRAS